LARHLEGACLRYIAYPVRADNLFELFLDSFFSRWFFFHGVGSRCPCGPG
jgi:hypothetical protein